LQPSRGKRQVETMDCKIETKNKLRTDYSYYQILIVEET
jgi:hypothetical protein